jgi:hypothetical protein
MIDNIDILRAIDERQQQAEGRPLWISAHQLLAEISGTYAADPQLMPGFLQELLIAEAAGHLTWRLTDQRARLQDANYYLQQIRDLALTTEGQDRARGRMIERPAPSPARVLRSVVRRCAMLLSRMVALANRRRTALTSTFPETQAEAYDRAASPSTRS